MGISAIRDQKTTRTFPRLVELNDTGEVILWNVEGALGMFITGPRVGQTVPASGFDFEKVSDLVGSVTVYNSD